MVILRGSNSLVLLSKQVMMWHVVGVYGEMTASDWSVGEFTGNIRKHGCPGLLQVARRVPKGKWGI